MPEASVVFLALAVSLDGFGVGMACGIRRLEILFSSLMVICLMSVGAVVVSMVLGQVLGIFISPEIAPRGGGVILLILGSYFTYQALKDLTGEKDAPGKKPENRKGEVYSAPRQGNLKRLSLMTREPGAADVDQSGTLSAREAFWLGVALAADAFGAGFGAVLVGFNPVLTAAAVGITKLLLVPAGVLVGRSFSARYLSNFAPLLSGLMLFLLGVMALV